MIENEVNEAMLREVAKKGMYGATRDDLFRALKGINYNDLEKIAQVLEKKGYVTIDWIDACDFVIMVTPKGMEQLT